MADFYSFLEKQDDASWAAIVAELEAAIHPVDRRATQIWFSFFPVKLWRALTGAESVEAVAKRLILKGNYLLREQVDSSAEFLYGHRHWPAVKQAVSEHAAAGSEAPLAGQIRDVARRVAEKTKAPEAILLGITAVAFGTLQQVGAELFRQPAAAGRYGRDWNKSADQVVADRLKDDGQGLLGFLKTVDKQFSVAFREYAPQSTFKIMDLQDVTMAAALDKRDHHTRDPRCPAGEGPIPVECRTAACGTCWVGVLSPTDKISPPNDREKNKWRYFGYEGFTAEQDSPIRLACQMKAHGNITLVIPPWCGMIGKLDEKEQAKTAQV
ncbi:MAG: 2Fe-2S iron-sulfur cluster-binding protein [Blastocatellia bacterium]|nr:2Fe-2S iron-sulfur cluster-binding protein [Blastocatellia bacterium]